MKIVMGESLVLWGPNTHISERDDTLRDCRWLDTSDRIRDRHMYDFSPNLDNHHDSHWYHPYKEMIGDICWMILRKKSHEHLMER